MPTFERGRRGTGLLRFDCPRRIKCEVLAPVLLLDRGAIMRQGHSGASGQGDVTWSLHPHRQSKMRRQKMQRDLFFFCGNQILSKDWGERSRCQYVCTDRMALSDGEVSVWTGQSG